MKHLRVAFLTLASAIALFWVVSEGTYELLKTLVGRSQFRLAVAMNASRFSGQDVSLLVGDSRIMDGVNAALVSAKEGRATIYNAAFNGVEYPEAFAIVEGFISSC